MLNTNYTSSLAFLSRDFVDSREKCSPRQVSLSYCLKSRFKLRPTPHTLLGIKICFLDTKICAMLDKVCCIFLVNSANSVIWVSHWVKCILSDVKNIFKDLRLSNKGMRHETALGGSGFYSQNLSIGSSVE